MRNLLTMMFLLLGTATGSAENPSMLNGKALVEANSGPCPRTGA